MTLIKALIDIFLHLDKNLQDMIDRFGTWIYIILFIVIFMETGFVVTPFLPGDSLIFAAGALSGAGMLKIIPLYLSLLIAAWLGDTVNYWIGNYIGPRAFTMNSKLLKKEYLEKAHLFYEKHGNKAIVLARFVPIVRTFAPFVAGIAKMNYKHFITYNLLGGFLWVSLFTFLGYFFGNTQFVKDNFHYTVVAIILISLIPIGYEYYKGKSEKKSAK